MQGTEEATETEAGTRLGSNMLKGWPYKLNITCQNWLRPLI